MFEKAADKPHTVYYPLSYSPQHLSLSNIMLFSRVASFIAFFLTLGILAAAKPVELGSRANDASVQSAIATLQSKTNTILPQISG